MIQIMLLAFVWVFAVHSMKAQELKPGDVNLDNLR